MQGLNYIKEAMESKVNEATQLFNIDQLSGDKLKDRLYKVRSIVATSSRATNDACAYYRKVENHIASLKGLSSAIKTNDDDKDGMEGTVKDFEVQLETIEQTVREMSSVAVQYIFLRDALEDMYTRESE